ncbi:hypothetical protein CCICO_09430 [Corynebacterium ciconiae DSM 44920]|uniref:hypothetical protein n=1 Tax=Corynebacterium ciconiae TaxID=227319 RepID=UPI000364F455|nr:hypothetical protein [Corynebacterium ciconiae]WKD61894.1 hypothetical protein CCICO_09430 [Corynebacterium ciconiae DSM 44920]
MPSISEVRSLPTPIPTPTPVRLGTSVLFGLGVAALSTSLPRGVQVATMVLCIGVGVALIFTHPYRQRIRSYLEERGMEYRTRAGMLMPLFPVWLALMLAPVTAPAALWATALLGLATFGWMWLVFPHVDGTRMLAYVDQADTV